MIYLHSFLPSSSSCSSFLQISRFNIHKIIILIILVITHSSDADIAVISPMNRTVDVFLDVELGFASQVPYNGLFGRVVIASPEDACSEIEGPPKVNNSLKWIVLIKRFPCQYQQKVRNAMKAGFDAAIIYNIDFNSADRGPSLRFSSQSETGINIPAVLVSFDDGWTLKKEYLYKTGYYIMIIPELPFNINAYLLPFAIVIGICLILMTLFMVFQIVKCIRDRRRLRRHRLTSRHLKQIPIIKFKKGDQYDTCAICLEEYIEGEKLRVLPCGHAYHIKCIDPWLTKNRRVCPVCKGKVVLPGMSDVSDTESESENRQNVPSVNENTPLLNTRRTGDRQRNRRQRIRSHQRNTNSLTTEVENYGTNDTTNDPTTSVECTTADPNVTLVQADIALAPNDYSVNCDYDNEHSDIPNGQLTNDTQRTPLIDSRRSRRQGVIV